MYHVAPNEVDEEIMVKGLRGDPRGWDTIVWLWDDLDTARAFAAEDETIWQVNVDSLEIEPGSNPPSRHGGLAWAAVGPISPALLCIVV